MKPLFLLLCMPDCIPCRNVKQHLDKLQYENEYELDFEYEIIDVSNRDDLVEQYDVMSVPVIVSPNGEKLTGNMGRDKTRTWLKNEAEKFLEEAALNDRYSRSN